VVEVRVFSWAPNSDQTRESGFFRFRPLIFNGKIDLYFSNQGFTDQKARRIVRPINSGNVVRYAQVVKLVDTPASGAGDRKVVEVRV
ncbi:hypothetical protein, partial [Pseudomonas fluorescens]|uniref:hypothetical protein n=2 Tax=Pseudomonas fluorescens TaxID=294 RepID=UPI001A7E40AE